MKDNHRRQSSQFRRADVLSQSQMHRLLDPSYYTPSPTFGHVITLPCTNDNESQVRKNLNHRSTDGKRICDLVD